MQKSTMSFYGASGREHQFGRVSAQEPWARFAGVAVFAATDAFGLRVIRIAELSGREHDVRPFWALHDAERYGADTVFIALQQNADCRKRMIADLEAGLSPVVSAASGSGMAMAA